jgi:hypothetical protein
MTRVVPIAALLLLAACQASTPLADSTGPIPPGWRADTSASLNGERLPLPLSCNNVYDVEGAAVRPVEACEGVDFKPLYDQALANAQQVASQIQCAGDCSDQRPHVQLFWHGFWCSSREAHAAVFLHLYCRSSQSSPLPGGVGSPASYTPQPIDDAPRNRPSAPVQFSSSLMQSPLACGRTSRVEFHYERRESNYRCAAFDFDGLRDTAKAHARDLHARYQCVPGCTKKPFQALHESWSCVENSSEAQATVTVRFVVDCPSQ